MPTVNQKIKNAIEQITILRTKIKNAKEHINRIQKVHKGKVMGNTLIAQWEEIIANFTTIKDQLKSAILPANQHLITGSSENSVRDIDNMSLPKLSDSSGGKSRRKYKSRKRRTRRNR